MLTKIKNELIYLSTLRRILSSLKAINNDENSIITKRIASFADKSPGSIAIYFEDREISYRELINGANQYSHWFLDNGLQKGDVVALLMENRPGLFSIRSATTSPFCNPLSRNQCEY